MPCHAHEDASASLFDPMWLTDCWIHGLRRFGGDNPHRVRFDAKLVCLIGANEAGKSTILDALELAHREEAVPASERTRREGVPDGREIVRLRYRLDDGDQEALAQIRRDPDGPQHLQWFEVVRYANGQRQHWAKPEFVRDRTERRAVRRALTERAQGWWPEAEEVADDEDRGESDADAAELEDAFAPDQGRVSRLIEALADDASTLGDTVPQELRELASEVEPHDADLSAALRQLADIEAAQSPDVQADELLWGRMPQFVRFDDRARLLDSEYDLNAADSSPGTALGNLIRLAQLDLNGLVSAINSGETGTVRDIRERANETLERRMEAWQQDPRIAVVLENEGALLRIHVQSGSGPTMAFRERSDGLRQFVALVALTAQQSNPTRPILLIDEVETHLHYNAQADLIDVLTTQTAARQVVYTTHSAACLPQDLGLGVRVVEGLGEHTASTVRQSLWLAERPGLGSLLMAMGASSLVYVTLRPGVIAEGESDLILLPTLMREAIGSDSLGFAVVPGASTTPPERIAGLDLQGVKTVWVLDADEAGRKRRSQLIALQIPGERILLLADDTSLEVEDLIAPATYVEAVRLYVADIGGADEFGEGDLPADTCQRHETVEAWCDARQLHRPSKIAIALKLIELVERRTLLDPQHADSLRALHGSITALFSS